MSRLFIGNLDGVGPTVKIMANDTDDPRTTPNTDWWKFRFNSETAEIGYAWNVNDWGQDPLNYIGWLRYDASDWCRLYAVRRDNYGDSDDAYFRFGPVDPVHQLVSNGLNAWPQRMGTLVYENGSAALTYWDYSKRDATVTYSARKVFGVESLPVQPPYLWYSSELPIDETPYPATVGTPLSGKKIVRIDPSNAKIAKPGFDVDTATNDQLIVGHSKPPLLVARTGFFTLGPGAQQNIDVDLPISSTTLVDYQVNKTGHDLYLPAYPDNDADTLDVRYRIVGQQVQFLNPASISVDVRFFIMMADDLPVTSGNGKVLSIDQTNGFIRLQRPGSSATPNARDILLDSRATYMPMVAQGYVPRASFSSTGSYLGNRRYRVDLPAGDYKPYVLARAKTELVGNSGNFFYSDFFGKQIEIYDYMSRSTFLAHVSDTFIDFYASTDARVEDAWRFGLGYGGGVAATDFRGFRYYVFAVPNSL